MKVRMEELDRACISMRSALRDSNDERFQAFFNTVISRVEMILANEREGITITLADDLSNVRSAIRRLRLPDIDPDLDAPTPALKSLRSERGNLIESIDNALEAAAALRLHPRASEFGGIYVERQEIAEQLIRLDERLRAVQDAVVNLRGAATMADAKSEGQLISQSRLINIHIKTLRVETSAARFETQVGANATMTPLSDISALARSIEVMNEIAGDLKQTIEGLGRVVSAGVRTASELVVSNVERSWQGLKTIVSSVRRKLRPALQTGRTAQHQEETQRREQPADFGWQEIYGLVLVGRAPPSSWYPWIHELDFVSQPLINLAPLSGLSALRRLSLGGTQVSDLAPLSGLNALHTLDLHDTQVVDLAPLSGLNALQKLYLHDTQVSDVAPLAGLSSLHTLSLDCTQVSDLSPLSGLRALHMLSLEGTQVGDISPLAELSALRTLSLQGTQVINLEPLSGLKALQTLHLHNTRVDDLTPLSRLGALRMLSLGGTQVTDLTPLSDLSALRTLSLDSTLVRDLSPLSRLKDLSTVWVESEVRRAALAETIGSRRGQIVRVRPSTGN
jgi:hypothetical protein